MRFSNKHTWAMAAVIFAITALSIGFAPAGPRARAYSTAVAERQIKIQRIKIQADGQRSLQEGARELGPGKAIEREIAAGEAHSYLITLRANQYVDVVVEQKGIDVVVRMFGPDGQKLTEVDSPNGAQGPEPVYAIVESDGQYRLEVMGLEEQSNSGRYEIKVMALRGSTAKDWDRIAAARLLAEAESLRSQGTAESQRKAIEKYMGSLPLLRNLEDRYGEANTLTSIGSVSWSLGDNQTALEYYNQALPLWRGLGNPKEEATVLHNFGTVFWQLGDTRKALEYYNQAVPMMRKAGDRKAEGIMLGAIGLAHNDLGKSLEAIEYYNHALHLIRDTGSRRDEADILNKIGIAYYYLGELQQALEYYNQALLMSRDTGDRRREGSILNNIGVIYWQLGENEKALQYHNQALPLRRGVGDRPGEISTLQNFGVVHLALGNPRKALEYHNEALSLARAVGSRRDEAVALQNIGTVHRSSGDTQKALDYYNQSLLLRRGVGDSRGEASTLSRIGAIYSLLNKPEEALSHLERALTLHRSTGDRGTEAATLQYIARVERDRRRLGEARDHIEAALEIIESTRAKFISRQLRTSFLASRQSFYEFYTDLLMRMHREQPSAGHNVAALQASERARARSLLEMLIEAGAKIRQGVDPALLERERALQQQLSAKAERLTRLLSGKHNEEQAAAARKEVETLLEESQDIEAQIRTKNPRYAALTQPRPLALKEIQQQVLDENTVLLEYALGDDRSYLWMVTPTLIRSFELPKRAEIEAAASKFRDLVLTYKNRELKSQTEAAAALSRILLGPVVEHLGKKRLLIVSDGVVQYVPFAALPEPLTKSKGDSRYQPLIVNHEIVSLPSASVMAVLRREMAGRPAATKTVAVLADPVFQNDDPRLKQSAPSPEKPSAEGSTQLNSISTPKSDIERSAWEAGIEKLQRLQYSRKEAESIMAYAPNGQGFQALDFDANRALALDENLGQFRILHLATHGFINNVHPELSGIVLSLVNKDGRPENGFVRLHEIYNLKLPADLVVLSACQTALGKDVKGEGLVGLTRGFMYAGAGRVVVSLWAVSDQATAELMKKFYEGMLKRGMRPAAALRAAQISMSKSQWWESPYYWAAFIHQGEWR